MPKYHPMSIGSSNCNYVGKTSAHLAWHYDPDIRPAAYPGCQNGK